MHEPGFEDIAKLDLEAWSQSLRNPELLEMVREARKAVREVVCEVIQAAIDRGDYSAQVDKNGLASLFMAIFTGLRLNLLLTPEDVDAMAVLDALRLIIRGGLPGPKAPERQRPAAVS